MTAINTNSKIILDSVYIPRNASIEVYSKHYEVIGSIYFKFFSHYFVIVYDFNLNSYDWSVDSNIQCHMEYCGKNVIHLFLEF